jgi:hypothetical protein
MPRIWENGGEVNTKLEQTCNNFGDGSLCKDKDSNDLTFKNKPYPSPNPDFFAVLNKPGVNRHVMRGCFKAQPEGQADSPWGMLYNESSTICDDYQGSYCANPRNKEKCNTDAPGGLADFTHPMNTAGESSYLHNGFVIEQCECSMDSNQLSKRDDPGIMYNVEENGNSLYTCWPSKKYRAREEEFLGFDISPDKCCQTNSNKDCIKKGWDANITSSSNDNCSSFYYRGNNFTPYQDGELWDGRVNNKSFLNENEPTTCHHWYNPPLGELSNDKKDKNNCSQYLLKWAISCDWCKKNKPTNDAFRNAEQGTNNCPSPNECAGGTRDSLGQKICESELDESDCKICDSDIWDYVPGGWEALANKDNPKHLMAKFAYYPKVVKIDKKDSACVQPNSSVNDGMFNPTLTLDKDNFVANNKSVTTFMGLGPWTNEFTFADNETQLYTSNNPRTISYCANENWVENNFINDDQTGNVQMLEKECGQLDNKSCESEMKCKWDNEKCLRMTDNPISLDESIWSRVSVVGNKNNSIYNLSECGFKEGTGGFNYNPRSHTMCARNHNLTGYGESDKENSYLANLWLQGKWDMSNYTGKPDDIIDEDISDDDKKQRKVEAVRCCIGLSPHYDSTTKTAELHNEDLTRDRQKYCRPGFVCPSSDACKGLFEDIFNNDKSDGINYYQFGEAFPEGYQLEGNSELSDENMENITYYAKAYCEMMSGGTNPASNIDDVNGCAHDPNAEVNCRKAMYNYCVEPVEVNVQDPGGVGDGIETSKIGYPLRVFTDTCKDWCGQDKLSDSLPSQKGVCDMAMGKTCQQLQVDGWIDPTNWSNSKLLKFANPNGIWTENPPTEIGGSLKDHKNLTAKKIKNVCGCFLMGSECGSGNCSVSYCGAGTDGNKGPGMVSFGKNKDYKPSVKEGCGNEFDSVPNGNYVNEAICDMKAVYDYDGDSEARGWTENINSDKFTCSNSENKTQSCFSGCNYVNSNDTCWMASPDERKQDMVIESFGNFKNINSWECEDNPVGDSCKTYNDNLGCFGYCSVNDYTLENPKGNCGTDEWFNDRMNINPAEANYKQRKEMIEKNNIDKKPNVTYDWPQWQNYYTYWDQIPKSTPLQNPNTEYSISGWGTYTTGDNGRPVSFDGSGDGEGVADINKNVCTFSSCSDPDSLKPYRYYADTNNITCASNCSVSMQTTINNQGVVVGGIVSSLNGNNACQSNADWNPESLSNNNNANYIGLMGINDCSNQLDNLNDSNCTQCGIDSNDPTCDDCKKLLSCGYGSNVCVDTTIVGKDPQTGEDIISGDNCNLCLNPKPNICCTSPNINPYINAANSAAKISWDKANSGEGDEQQGGLLQTLGNRVSYICAKSCPNGSVNLKDLETKNCGQTPCDKRTIDNCNDCETCTWIEEDTENLIEAHCSAQCPKPSNNGWGVNLRNTEARVPIAPGPIIQTNTPPTSDTPPTDQPTGGISIGAIIGIIIGIMILLGFVYLFLKKKLIK